ncbi:type B DNA-directed DNA polymerase [Halosimplex salinum]|uniref:type B DNA-directed DNA polymerase n=1 Tax=Halosimplex salinum TaxID=1710538 RepID=UPI000F499528|nr:type B DNA-directed DNA polymerase [Halosimplex salinum]
MSLLTPEFRPDGTVREWHATADGVETRVNDDYAPSLSVAAPDPVRADLAAALAADPKVVETATERRYLSLDADEREPVLRVDLARVDEVRTLAHEILSHHAADYAPGTVRLYDVDLAPGFRYCVDTGTAPVPERELRRLELSIPERALAEDDLTALRVDGEALRASKASGDGGPASRQADRAVLDSLRERVEVVDPDVLVCSTAELIPRCHERAEALGLDDFRLGRADGYERLAGASTYESYGQVGHSPARYALPGRAIVDRSNSFLLGKAGLPGLLDLVGRSWRPLQETARGSIGTILTSIEIKEARERDVLAPWNKWEPEAFKSVGTLHDADRGGFTFAPEPGIYEDVVEVDFASLYPSIMREYNVSPETVNCDCHDREDVPGLGYSVCEDRGFLADVLGGLIDDRARFKEELAELRERAATDALDVASGDYQATHAEPDGDSPVAERVAALEGRIDALKWVLVSCFGYQGYRNAKFGRIECHEAINAYAREILLDAKERLEAGGWRVVHGIVDSLWVQPRAADPEPIDEIAAVVSEDARISLEVEARFDWVAFVPMRNSSAGALTKYYGKVAGADPEDDDAFKFRGIETRQRSTPPFVAAVQRDLIRTLDASNESGERSEPRTERPASHDPEAVCDRLARALGRLERRAVDAEDLVIRQRVSKSVEAYAQRTRTVAALERTAAHGLERPPGTSVEYVVVDDGRGDADRVRLPFEDASDYDVEFYRERLIRAAESVVSPLGWDRGQIRRYLRDGRDLTLAAFE